MNLTPDLGAQILPLVQRPSRYLGTELNSVHKDPERVDLRVCLAFPDSYDLGLGNLGLQILYHILNREPRIWAERVCAPHPDLEAILRERGLPLFSLESKTPLFAFDIVGFTLQWELNYTNILNMLDLGGIPVFAADRREGQPFVIAGGPCVFNPEPLAMFVDAFVIGDGEEVVLEVADAVRAGGGRDAVLDRLAAVSGCYVPALYPMREGPNGVLVKPREAPVITKRLVRDLDATPFPTDYLVPYTPQVHDRVSLEVLRGCTQGCRFCQAGMVTRPVRERSLQNLAALQEETIRRTGYEEISLVSLSTCDYSRVKSLVQQSVALAKPGHVAVSLPSLRLDSFSVDLAHQISSLRRTGLTFAPEAATDRMRSVINKHISTEELLEMARQCYGRGWHTLKLYFMIGLPTERDEDVAAIGELARQVLEVGRAFTRRARVNLGVSTFVPKPQTPFQWAEQIPPEEAARRQDLLATHLGPRAIKFGRSNPFESYLEGVISRGDRRTGWLLYDAWREGARFDGWDEYLDRGAWERAFARWEDEHGLSGSAALRARDVDEPLPWDHIDVMIPKGWFQADWERATRLEWQRDCRAAKCNRCGVIDVARDDCLTMLRRSREGAVAEASRSVADPPTWAEPPAVQRVRMRYARLGLVRLLSHQETVNVFVRALRRAGAPLRYSEGYHPHAAVSFGAALPVGMETTGDYLDVTLTQRVEPDALREALSGTLPEGFAILAAWEVPLTESALMAVLGGALYEAHVPRRLADDLPARIATLLARPEVLVQRRGKSRGRVVHRPVDIRPMIERLAIRTWTQTDAVVEIRLRSQDGRLGKVDEVLLELLGIDRAELPLVRVRKLAGYIPAGDAWLEPAPVGMEQVG